MKSNGLTVIFIACAFDTLEEVSRPLVPAGGPSKGVEPVGAAERKNVSS